MNPKIPLYFFLFFSFFSSGLYLIGFSFNGLNVYGFIDYLIPFERFLCLVNGVVMFLLSGFMIKNLVGEININENKKEKF